MYSTLANFIRQLGNFSQIENKIEIYQAFFEYMNTEVTIIGLSVVQHMDGVWDTTYFQKKELQLGSTDLDNYIESLRSQGKAQICLCTRTPGNGIRGELWGVELAWVPTPCWLLFECEKSVCETIGDETFTAIVSIIQNAFHYSIVMEEKHKWCTLAHTDAVTGLFNQRKFRQDIEHQISRHQKNATSFSVFFLDLDRFKRVNDQLGHRIGTEILSEFSEVLRRGVWETDLMYRYGGDEFILIFPSMDMKNSAKVAERLLKIIHEHTFLTQMEISYHLSISIGIAEYPFHGHTCTEIVESANKMLYKAKRAGYGQIRYHMPIVHLNEERHHVY